MPISPELLARYKRQIAVYRTRTAAILIDAWDALPAYDEDDLEQFTLRTATPLAGAKAAAVGLSAGFFALALGVAPVAVAPTSILIDPDLRGPFRATWHALAVGRPFDDAVRVGRSTAQAVGFDFVQSSARRTGDHVAAASGIELRWRRSPGAKSCAWCRNLSTFTWPTAESADFGHERDDCDVVPA